MTPQRYQPEGDPVCHVITAKVLEDLGGGLLFMALSDGEEIGEVDVDEPEEHTAFISGVGPGEKINNGYLRPASLAIASLMKDRDPQFKTLYDIDNQPLESSA